MRCASCRDKNVSKVIENELCTRLNICTIFNLLFITASKPSSTCTMDDMIDSTVFRYQLVFDFKSRVQCNGDM